MNIQLEQAGKRFNRDWIFRHLTFQFIEGSDYAITGPNGSGKSTLLQALAGSMNLTEGNISYQKAGKPVAVDDVYRDVAIVAPYLELIEEMSAAEFLEFHAVFKPLILPINDILSEIGLEAARSKQIRNFSSGMKQRVKLAQAIFSDASLLLLDEPCTNLDAAGYELYHRLISTYCAHRTVIVSSNDPNEYSFCAQRINIMDYKTLPATR